jgi:hypothetical protein
MSLRTVSRGMTLLLGVGLLLTFCAAPSLAQEKITAAGTMTMTQASVDTMIVGNTEGHTLSVSRSTGTNAATGESKLMDGAQAVNVYLSDLVNGNGPHHGYLTLVRDGNSIFVAWKGTVTTVPGKEAPLTSFAGTYHWTGGTGEYAKITGSGTYRGRYTSKTTYTAEWTGQYSFGK